MNNIISENDNSTVLAEYKSLNSKVTSYQSEAQLEIEFIKTLQEESYEYLLINNEKDLISNLRKELEKHLEIENLYETTAGCVISSHCGEGTIGILYITK